MSAVADAPVMPVTDQERSAFFLELGKSGTRRATILGMPRAEQDAIIIAARSPLTLVPAAQPPMPAEPAEAAPTDQTKKESENESQHEQTNNGARLDNLVKSIEAYASKGLAVCAVVPKGKAGVTGWNEQALTKETAASVLKENSNIGIRLGAPSNGVVDLDLDAPEVPPFVDILMPGVPSMGRAGNPRSHRFVRCAGIKATKFKLAPSLKNHLKIAGRPHGLCFAEIRSDGDQTVVAPSIHESGDVIRWDNGHLPAEFPIIAEDKLRKLMGLAVFCAFCVRFDPGHGARNDYRMAVGGAFAQAGVDIELAKRLAAGIAKQIKAETDEWINAVSYSYAHLKDGDKVTGIPKLLECAELDPSVGNVLREWLGIGQAAKGDLVSATDHMARARRVIEKRWPNLRHYRDDFFDFADGRYAMVADDTIRADTYEYLDTCTKGDGKKIVPFQPDAHAVNETIGAAKAVRHVLPTLDQPCWLDGRNGPDPADLVVFKNGILNLKTNEFLPPDPMLFTANAAGLDYDPSAPTPTNFLNFLREIFDGEDDQINGVQEMMGYDLTADVSQEKMFALIGPKRSGKDTLRNVLCGLLPLNAVCGPTLANMATQFGMEVFINKQLAIVGDMRLGAKADQDILAENILKLTGRSLFTIPRKHKRDWTGYLPCKLLILSNERPRIRDTSGAVASRMIGYQTRQSFYGRENTTLFRDKLQPELPGILLFALEGLRRMRARGRLHEPAASVEAREQMARDGSPVLAFITECLDIDPEAKTLKDAVYAAYVTWAEAHRLHTLSRDVFMRDLGTASGEKIKTVDRRVMIGGKRVPCIVGARLKGGEPDQEAIPF